MAFYKLPAIKGHSRIATVFWLEATSALLAAIVFHRDLFIVNHQTFLLAFLAGITFALVTMLQMYALSHVDTNTLFPVTTTLSLVFAVLVGLLFFVEVERLSVWQGAGIALSIAVVYLFSRRSGKWRFSPILLWLVLLIPTFSASFKIIQKLAADSINIRTFQIYAYLFAALFSLVSYLAVAAMTPKAGRRDFFIGSMGWGSLNGVFSFLGGSLILVALVRGPFTLVTSIQSLYVIVTALIGYFLFKEKLGTRQCILILLSILAVWFMRLG